MADIYTQYVAVWSPMLPELLKDKNVLQRLSVSSRIFLCCTLLTMALISFAVYALQSTVQLGEKFRDYRATARQTIAVNLLIEDLFEARVAALKYRTDASEENARDVAGNIQEIIDESDDIGRMFSDGDSISVIQSAKERSVAYLAAFSNVEAARQTELSVMQNIRQNTLGVKVALDEMWAEAPGYNVALQQLLVRARESALLVLWNAERFQSSGDSGFADSMQEEADRLAAYLGQIPELTTSGALQDKMDAIIRSVEDLRNDVSRLDEIVKEVIRLEAGVLDAIGPAIQDDYERIAEAIVDQQNELGPISEAIVAKTQRLTPIIALGCVTLAILVGYFVGRSVTRPLQRLAETTEVLASGETDVHIQESKHKHELGVMTNALMVFRQAHIDREQIAQERADQAKKEQEGMIFALRTGLEELASGRLSHRIDKPFSSEYEALREDYNLAMQTIAQTIESLQQCAEDIRIGVGEMSSSSTELSQRTENQAAALEETAAAIEEMTQSIKSTAETVERANSSTQSTKENATKSGQILAETVEAISEVTNSSRTISATIKVIDDIAFQTNLLALNAGVEAARAGDAGRGFAVVASEVRALAQRASDAANEVNTIIKSSTAAIEKGEALVAQTNEAVTRIVEQISGVSDMMSEVNHTANEQKLTVAEISSAVSELDQVTQQNAAMAEEASAATLDLDNQCGTLDQLTSQFSTGSQKEHLAA